MNKLFGTDGIRGKADEFPLDEATVSVIGASLARIYREKLGRRPHFVTGRDTRESGERIEAAIHKGAAAEGAECLSAGVITTPGVAYTTGSHRLDAGIVVSASHNPFDDNGIKIFTPTGRKADASIEQAVEHDIRAGITFTDAGKQVAVDRSRESEFQEDYLRHLADRFAGLKLSGTKIALDCANGAACGYAERLFASFGARVSAIHDRPDGRNINENCGSLHLEHLQASVIENGADIGIAFDGDADRSLFVDEKGRIVDGDTVLWVMAKYLQGRGKLENKKVVATVMSNIGLEAALRSRGIELIRAAVGDKYVLDELLASGSDIGGEQSGHIIFPKESLVGDGMLTGLYLLRAIREFGGTLSEACEGFVRYPQVLVNVKVREKRPFEEVESIKNAADELNAQLDGNGRLLLRYSGTEDLARVMIEGKDQNEIDAMARSLADTIKQALG